MSTRRVRLAGLAAAAALVVPFGLSGCSALDDGAYGLPLPGGVDVGDDPDTITVEFANVEGLVPQAQVRMSNVGVGEVTDLEVDQDTWTAVATLSLRRDLDLPADVTARVRRSSLLGEWYVELVRPAPGATGTSTGAPLAADATIPLARTGGSVAVEDVLGALSLLLNNGGLPQVNVIVRELNQALDGNEAQVKALLGDLTEFTTTLDRRRDDIVRALDGLATLSRTLDDNRAQLATALDRIPEGLAVLADQEPQLTAMLRSLDRLSGVAVRVVEQSKDDVVADLELLRPVLTKLTEAGDDLPKALQILATFPFTPGSYDAFAGDYLNLEARVELDLDAVLSTLVASDLPLYLGGQELPNPLPLLQGPADLLDGLIDGLGPGGLLGREATRAGAGEGAGERARQAAADPASRRSRGGVR
ncbi:MCE family protein [Nocardioides sp.]|uniref:MCE family protein n=1 Tax=Nocardioides sp. TaxID=35761 RepID=UPI003518FD13